MDFSTWLGKAWNDHADDPAGVGVRLLEEGPALAQRSDDVVALGRLAHHVYGEHLGRWHDGREALRVLGTHPHGADAAASLNVFDASLALCGDEADTRDTLGASDRIRVTALAAGNLATHAPLRAGHLLREAIAAAEATSLADQDPACRALAVTGNNMACALEEKANPSDEERGLMILAAQTARQYWARAGTWLETERAEYRLAQSYRHAGDLAAARRHAQACLDLVSKHGSPALEEFFGWEALGLVERAAGNTAAHRQAVEQARDAFARLAESDRGWCQASLDALAAPAT